MTVFGIRWKVQSLVMDDFNGKTVVITGGSTGIGAAFAARLAARGARLVLVSRSSERLEKQATLLRGKGAEVLTLAEDLSKPGVAPRVHAAVHAQGWQCDLLINNAGFGAHGRFEELSIDLQREEIDLNVGALVELTYAFLPDLLARKGASTASFQPLPYMAVYGATKAFVLSFSEALWGEFRARGVRVLALCPGATDTRFFERAGEAAAVGKMASPDEVVDVGLRAYSAGRSYAIVGAANYFTAHASRFVTRQTVVKISSAVLDPRQPKAALPAAAK
jgi:uncharacterized protein